MHACMRSTSTFFCTAAALEFSALDPESYWVMGLIKEHVDNWGSELNKSIERFLIEYNTSE
jgi:hypothetical protein